MTALATSSNARSRQQWAEIINADWRKSIDSIIQTGRDLADAKAELPHGEFLKLIKEDLPFSVRTADNLMSVAQHPAILNSPSTANLPPSWAVLSELTRLTEHDFKDAAEKGLISPSTSLRQARSVSEVYLKPDGVIGEGRSPSALPTPDEARKLARDTGRLVAASDNRIYTGSSKEESAAYSNKRDSAFDIIEAIEILGDAPPAIEWFETTERHWFHDFRYSALDDAIEFLTTLKAEMGVVDA